MLFDQHTIMLAPMAGITDAVFRSLCIEKGANMTFTEMVSAKGLSYANAKTQHLLELAPNESLVSVQIFGHEPDTMAHQAQWIEHMLEDKLFSLNINMGCPAKKIASKGDGSALMRDPSLAAEIIRAVSSAVSVPVTVKFRRGYELNHDTSLSFARMAEASGAAGVIIHGRYAQQFYRGEADWDCIARAKEALCIPVVGNGDVVDGKSAQALIAHTNCDAVMVGRAAQGNPWVFRDIASVLTTGKSIPLPTVKERMDLACKHALLLSRKEGSIIIKMRKHAMSYVTGLPKATELRQAITSASTYEDFEKIFSHALSLSLRD